MIKCPKCGQTLEDGAKFCDNCGASLESAAPVEPEFEMVFCPNCGQQTSTQFAFCQNCGASLNEEPPEEPAPEPVFETVFCPNCGQQTSTQFAFCQNCGASLSEESPADGAKQKKGKPRKEKSTGEGGKGLPKKALLFGAIGAAVVVVIVLLVVLLSGGGKDRYALYMKDDELVYSDLSKAEPWEVTSHLSKDGDNLAYYGLDFGNLVAFNEDHSRIFFPDKISRSDDGFTLYYRSVGKPKAEAEKVDSDIIRYAITPKGDGVVYLKGDDGDLYWNDLKNDKEKIDSDVTSMRVSEDAKTVLYVTEDSDVYIWTRGKDKSKVVGDIEKLEYVPSDLSAVYYIKDDDLCMMKTDGKGDKVKIASDVYDVVQVYSSGEVYYVEEETVSDSLMSYVTDDMAASDAAMSEPQRAPYPTQPSYPSYWSYGTTEAYQAALTQYNADYAQWSAECDRIDEEYDAARDAYYAKRQRDSLRSDLENNTLDRTQYTLYYYDGKNSTTVSEAVTSSYPTTASDSPVVLYQVYNEAEVDKINLSELEGSYQVWDLANSAMYESAVRYVASGADATPLDLEDVSSFRLSSDGSRIYYLQDADDEEGDLYQITFNKGKVGDPELYDSDVCISYYLLGDKLEYYKDADDEEGELYINKEKVDDDVRLGSASFYDDTVLYYTDYSSSKYEGTLKMWKKGDPTDVADDVHSYLWLDGDLLYIYDYNSNRGEGDLGLWHNGKSEKIDEDVQYLLQVSGSRVKGGYYGW